MSLPVPAPRPERRRDPASCGHAPGRPLPSHPIVREMLRALGVVTCDDCFRATRIAARTGWRE